MGSTARPFIEGVRNRGDRVPDASFSGSTQRYPDLINDEKLLENSFLVPDAAPADVPASLRAPAEPTRGAAGSGGNGSLPRVAFLMA